MRFVQPPRARVSLIGAQLRRLLACLICTASFLPVAALAQSSASYSEDAIKAAYLYRFAGYVEWPGESVGAPADPAPDTTPVTRPPFTIAVMGASGVADRLHQLLPSLKIKDRPAHVRTITALSELRDAQILYVRAGSSNRVQKLIDSVPKKVLVITDDAAGLEMGSVINFVQVGRKVRFEVSLIAAQRKGFRVSSELLALAVRVDVASRAPPCSQPGVIKCDHEVAQR